MKPATVMWLLGFVGFMLVAAAYFTALLSGGRGPVWIDPALCIGVLMVVSALPVRFAMEALS